MMKGKKDDVGKADWDAMPLEVVELLVQVFESGIKVKGYGRHNCLLPFTDYRPRFFSAMMRHARECQADPTAFNADDRCYHAAQVAFNALMLLHHGLKEKQTHAVNSITGSSSEQSRIEDLGTMVNGGRTCD